MTCLLYPTRMWVLWNWSGSFWLWTYTRDTNRGDMYTTAHLDSCIWPSNRLYERYRWMNEKWGELQMKAVTTSWGQGYCRHLENAGKHIGQTETEEEKNDNTSRGNRHLEEKGVTAKQLQPGETGWWEIKFFRRMARETEETDFSFT